jgi:hypothetical protein
VLSVDTMGSPAATTGRSAFRLSHATAFAVYGLLLLLLALGRSWWGGHFVWTMPLAEFVVHPDLGDPVYFAAGARDVARTGWFTAGNAWLIHLWPPGFMLLEGAFLRVLGERGPVLLALLVASAAACAFWMVLLRAWLAEATKPVLATVAPLLPFVFPLFPFFLLDPHALVFGECFSISLFLAGFLLALLAFRRQSLSGAAMAGVLIAAAAYFRSQFELLVLFLTLGGVILAAIAAAGYLAGRRTPATWDALPVMVVLLLAAHGTMAPWRLHNAIETGDAGWVQTSRLVFENALKTPEAMVAAGGAFVVAGGGTLACELEPSFCGQKDAIYFYTAFLRNMDRWIVRKAQALPAFWMAPPSSATLGKLEDPPTPLERAANLLLAACLVVGLWRLWRLRREPVASMQAWLQLSVLACLLAVYILVHLEARYLFLPKIFAVIALLSLFGPPAAAPARR